MFFHELPPLYRQAYGDVDEELEDSFEVVGKVLLRSEFHWQQSRSVTIVFDYKVLLRVFVEQTVML